MEKKVTESGKDKNGSLQYDGIRRTLKKTFIFFLILDLLVTLFIFYLIISNPQKLVYAKYALFTHITRNKSIFYESPEELVNNGFKFDTQKEIVNWSIKLKRKFQYIREIKRSIISVSDIEKIKAIVLSFSKNGGRGCFGDLKLMDKLEKINTNSGKGCCTDHTQTFIAISSVYGIVAREVHTVAKKFINGHVMNEYFDKRLKKWIWVDPLFALLAKNSDGEYLSLLDIRQNLYQGNPVIFEFFGNQYHYFKNKDPHKFTYFENKYRFSDIMMTLGDNVFEAENFNYKYKFLPKPIRQFVGLMTGVLPTYLIYVDKNSCKGIALRSAKYIYVSIFLILAIGTICYPFFSIVSFWNRRTKGEKF